MNLRAILHPLSSILFLLPATTLAADAPTPAQIQQSIHRGVQFLLNEQAPDGSWPGRSPRMGMDLLAGAPDRPHPPATDPDGGRTALVTLALLSSGESPQSEPLKKSIDFLKKKEMNRTYSVALRAAVYSMLPEQVRKKELQADALWLRKAMHPKGPLAGLYTYGANSNDFDEADLSNSQYGVLGVWYAAESGLEIPLDYWKKVELAWLKSQHPDGGWSYRANQDPHAQSYTSMTLAGLATLYITQDYLHSHEAHLLSSADSSIRNPQSEIRNSPISKGISWLTTHFSIEKNTNAGRYWTNDDTDDIFLHYMLFGFERVGEASGLTRFGDHTWFAQGAKYLLDNQQEDGSWSGSTGPTIDTSFSLLFLSRGLSPVALQKLQLTTAPWNNRPRDVANIARWLRHQTERHINWQIVSIDADDDELLDAPILYLASQSPVTFTKDQKQKLKHYLAQGGLLLCLNDGAADLFPKSIEQLAKDLYPDYAMRDLPPDHPIFNENFPIKNLPYPVRALSNGSRELILLIPTADLSWQYQSYAIAPTNPNQSFPLIADLYLYTTHNSNPRYKRDWLNHRQPVEPQHATSSPATAR